MMPDGSIDPAGTLAACNRMHSRLVAWGRIILAGGNGPREKWESDDDQMGRRDWTGAEMDAARMLHSAVIRLPEVRQRLVLQVFYRERMAEWWEDWNPERRYALARDLTIEVNARIRRYNATVMDKAVSVRGDDFDGIRLRAIRVLVNNERVLP